MTEATELRNVLAEAGGGNGAGGVRESIPLPKRQPPKGMLPSTWLSRGLRIEYEDGTGKVVHTKGILLDYYPAGPVVAVGGAKTMFSWDRLVLCELIED